MGDFTCSRRAHPPASGIHFWKGFGFSGCPSFEGKTVLDLGCGTGKRTFEAVAHGATRVVGVDPIASAISAAGQSLMQGEPILRDRVFLFQGLVDELPEEKFDVILSENTFEHVLNVPEVLTAVRNRLKPGGRFFLGFGPLYHAPDGDHGWLRATLPGWRFFIWPWGHLLFEKYAFRRLSRSHGRPITQTRDWPYLNLNRHSVSDYKRMFDESGMTIEFIRTNLVGSPKGRLLAAAARLSWLSKYCTLNMFVILSA